MSEITEFITNLFGTESWPARWNCGVWTGFHGWLYILSDVAIGLAYFTIPIILVGYMAKKEKLLFKNLFFLFSLFIFACGTTHILDAVIFWEPVYRLSAAARFMTAGVSWVTVFMLFKVAPEAMNLKTSRELQLEVESRKKSENKLKTLQAELEDRIKQRTNELYEANKLLKAEIEERKSYERQLKAREEQFRAIVESSPNAIVVVNKEGYIVQVNRKTEDMFGYHRDEITDSTVEKLLPETYQPNHREYREDYFQKPQARPMGAGRNLYARHKSGHEIPVEIGLSPMKTGTETLVVSSIVDITQRKQIEDKLLQKNKELEASHAKLQNRTSQLIQSEKMSALGVLIAGVAHELNNPITGILNYAQYCSNRISSDKKATKVLDDLIAEAKRCESIVKNLLTYTRHAELTKQDISDNPAEDLKRVVHILQFRTKDVKLNIDVDEQLPPCAIDKHKFQQIIMNLLQNAVDALEPSDKKEISMTSKATKEYLEITITDTGIGIPKNNFDKIFDPFFTTKEVGKGTGLGLSITKSIIDDCDGDISLRSEQGKGTEIRIKLPLK